MLNFGIVIAPISLKTNRKGEFGMLKDKRTKTKAWLTGLIIGSLSLMATSVFAKTIDLKSIGTLPTLWIIIGVSIVLLQLIPAAILFFSFIGVTSSMVFKRKKATEEVTAEEKVVLPGYEPAPVQE